MEKWGLIAFYSLGIQVLLFLICATHIFLNLLLKSKPNLLFISLCVKINIGFGVMALIVFSSAFLIQKTLEMGVVCFIIFIMPLLLYLGQKKLLARSYKED